MRRSGITLVRFSRGMQGLMLVLSFLALANAQIVCVPIGGQAIVEATCEVGLPALKSAMSTLACDRLEPTSRVLDHLKSFPLPVSVAPPLTSRGMLSSPATVMQDNLYSFVQVFLF
jgi:hypothetical protein